MKPGQEKRVILREALLALLVLSLTFLNFGHDSAVMAAGGRVVITDHSICGDPLVPSDGDHFACHGCRPDVAAVPPAPTVAEPVCPTAVPVTYAIPPAPGAETVRRVASQPRAPPLTA